MARYHRHSSSVSLPALLAVLVGLAIILLAVFKFGGALTPSQFGAFDRFNVVVSTPAEVRLLSFNFVSHSLSDVIFPSDLYTPELTHGYGSYLLGKVYSVGELDKRGGVVLTSTVRELVGAPIDAYIVSTTPLDLANKNAFLTLDFLLTNRTNLSLLDRLRFAWAIAQVRSDRRLSFDLSLKSEKLILPDNSQAQSLEKDSLDIFLGNAFIEPSIQDEHLRLEVINTTAFAGLGTRASRIITAIGGSVIMVNSQEQPIDQCQILFSPSVKDTRTLKRLANIFDCAAKPRATSERAEITLLLGERYVRELTK